MATPAQKRKLQEELGELIATQKRAKGDQRNFRKYRDDPVGFIMKILMFQPWFRQIEIAETVRDHPLVAVPGSVAAGKDAIAAALSLWWIYARDGLVLSTSASARQVHETFMRAELGKYWRRANLPGQIFNHALRIGSRTRLLAHTSTDVSRLTGHHEARVLCVLSEAQGLEVSAYEAMLSNAQGEGDRILAVGNPLAPEGTFFTICQPTSDWRMVRMPATEHPNITGAAPFIPGGPTKAGIARIERMFGKGSPQYLARILAVFPEDAEFGLANREWIERAFERVEGTTMTYPNGMKVAL